MNRDALVVGINQYSYQLKDLKSPANSAEAIAQRLKDYGDFRVSRLPESIQENQRQIDQDGLVSTEDLRQAIIQLFNPEGKNVPETALLYFIGHGVRRNLGGVTEGFLATSDTNTEKNQWGVSLRWLRDLLQISKVPQQIVWLDCCFAGELLNFNEADLGTAGQGQTRFLIAAAREFEPAEEDIQGQHGAFSQILLDGLDPIEGVVNNDRLIEYIAQNFQGTPQQPIWYNPNTEIILTGKREQASISTAEGICPYKGLRFFEVEDAPYYYGREALTERLIEGVQVGKGNFLAVLGVSGSGKSSLLRAGLMYQLQEERRLPGTKEWKIRIFTPGEQPLVSLATAFLEEEATDGERYEEFQRVKQAINQGAKGFAEYIQVSQSPRTVLIVDQFEEVFAASTKQTERSQFITILLGALKQTGDKLCLIFAMRDDFLGKCAVYRELADLIQANLVMVTPMSAQELRLAIVEPATKLGRRVQENLISAILKDLGVEVQSSSEGEQISEPEPGMLPLLEYTLEQLWQRQTLNLLKLDSYNQLGGVQTTLENLAEEAYKELSEEEQGVADQIFIKLTQLGEGTPDTRKQVPQQDLVTQSQSAALVEQVIQKLAKAKLIVTSEQRKGQEKVAVVDVAHEALIRYWSRLRELLDNNREAIRTEGKIQAAAEEWRDKEKSRDYLLTGLRLGEAERFLQDEVDIVPLSSLAIEFIEESQKEQERLQKERSLRARLTLIGFATFSTVVSILAGVATWGWKNAEHQQQRTFVRELSAQAQLLQEEDDNLLEVSILLAIESKIRGKELGLQPLQADQAIHRGIALLPNLAIRFPLKRNQENNYPDDYWWLSFTSDSKYIATVSDDAIRLLEINNGEKVIHINYEKGTSLSPDGRYVAIPKKDIVEVRELISNQIVTSIPHEQTVKEIVFSPKNGYITISSETNQEIWKIQNFKEIKPIAVVGWHVQLIFSSDENYLAELSEENIRVWQIQTSNNQPIFNRPGVGVSAGFAFLSANGKYLVAATSEGVKVWEVSTGKEMMIDSLGSHWIPSMSLSQDGKYLAIGSRVGVVRVVEVPSAREVFSIQHSKTSVNFLTFSPDGKYLAIGGGNTDKFTRVIAIPSGEEFKKIFHQNGVWNIKFSPNGKYIAGYDGFIFFKVWNVTREQPIKLSDVMLTSNSISSNEKYLSTKKNNILLIKEVLSGKEIQKIKLEEPISRLISNFVFSPNSKYIAGYGGDFGSSHAETWDGILKVWQVSNGNPILSINLERLVSGAAFSPDEKFVAARVVDDTTRVWELIDDKQEVKRIKQSNLNGSWGTVAFSTDGKYLITIDDKYVPTGESTFQRQGKKIQTYLWQSEDLITEACTHLSRNLSLEEWQKYLPDESYRITCPNLPVHPSITNERID
ncbi:MAG: hypothetical protein F6K21_10900 [Symploca sp. SIO2D2]|nr:hypothetical protein [Symploca sp. SIO2D2]